MGRSNYAILAMGLAGALVLSTLMKYFLKAADERREEPMVRELMLAFGDRLEKRCKLRFDADPDHEGGARAVLSISPSMLGISLQSLVRDMGELVWRSSAEDVPLTSVVVEVIPWQRGREPERIPVPRPYMSRRRSVPRTPKPESEPALSRPPSTAPAEVAPTPTEPADVPAATPPPEPQETPEPVAPPSPPRRGRGN